MRQLSNAISKTKAILFATLLCLGWTAALSAAEPFPSFKALVKQVAPSVVNLSVVKSVRGYSFGGSGDPFLERFFGRFFGDGGQGWFGERSFRQRSLGSGVIIDAGKGLILTNNHVVEGANQITVKLYDKRELDANVAGRDPKTDLAVVRLKHPPNDLKAAVFGDSESIEVGDWVVAIGSPFGLEQTVSHGIISAKGRVIGGGPYDDFLQTDAPINPGNSGGPLVDMQGRVIGINTAITSRSGGSEGIGFAIPSEMARRVYVELAEKGKVTRGWLGVQIQDLNAALAEHFGLGKNAKGVLVADVLDRGPAHDAGLKAGDVILRYDGRGVDSVRDLQRLVAGTPVGREVRLELWRDRKPKSLVLKVADMAEFDDTQTASVDDTAPAKRLGLELRALGDEERKKLNLRHGVGVLAVESGSAAERAGLRPGDIILEFGNVKVESPSQLRREARKLKAGEDRVLRVLRDGRSLYLTLSVPEN